MSSEWISRECIDCEIKHSHSHTQLFLTEYVEIAYMLNDLKLIRNHKMIKAQ